MLMTNRQRYVAALTAIMITAVAWTVYFQTQLPNLFFYKEQNTVFVLSGDYLADYFKYPAWMACLIGDFLTQFYYYLYAGAAILGVSLAVLGTLALLSLRRVGTGVLAATLLSVALMSYEAVSSFYFMHRLSSLYAMIIAFAIYLVFSALLNRCRYYAVLIALLLSPVVYWLCGYGLWIFHALLLMRLAVMLMRRQKVVQYAAVVALPVICAVAILGIRHCCPLSVEGALTYPGIGKLKMPNRELERYLAVDNEFYFGRYNNVIQMVENTAAPSEQMQILRCMAYARQGRLTDVMTMPQKPELGTFVTINEKSPITAINLMNELYYTIGDMTMTERAAMMAMVFSPQARNSRYMKRLAEANLVSGDTAAAMKFLRILDKTIVYHKWAQNHIPATQTPKVKVEIAEKAQFVNTADSIVIGDDCHTILTNLLDANPKNTVALDYLLCSDMLAGKKEMFIDDYNKYGPRPKAIYLQALRSAQTPD